MNKNLLTFIFKGSCPIINFSTLADYTDKMIIKKAKGDDQIRKFSTVLLAEDFAMKMFTDL